MATKEPLVEMARAITGKMLAGNANTAKETKSLLNKFNDSMYGR